MSSVGVQTALVPPEFIPLEGGDDESGLERIVTPINAQPAMRPVSRKRQTSILFCAFLDVFVTIGLNQAYGVFLQHYLTDGSSPKDPFLSKDQVSSKALVAFVGTLGAGLTWGGSIGVNPLMARAKDPRYITGTGAVLIGLGYVLASFCNTVRIMARRLQSMLIKCRYGSSSLRKA